MTPEKTLEFVTDVLEVLDLDSDYGDVHEAVFTCVRNRRIIFNVNANDLFWWATADGVEITPENLPVLKQAIADVRTVRGLTAEPKAAINNPDWDWWYHAGHRGATLFCARVRAMRPQRPCYRTIPAELHPLFDACGPERDPKDEG